MKLTNCKCTGCQCEKTPIVEIDNMGREKFWEDLGRPNE